MQPVLYPVPVLIIAVILLMVLFGALLFYFSDVILAANKFWKPWRYNRISLVFYYSGQLLIALSAGYFG